MNITLQSTSTCSGGEHRTVVTDKGSFVISNTDLQTAAPDDFETYKIAAIIVTKHQYLTRRSAGRTHAQALGDLVNFVVRV